MSCSMAEIENFSVFKVVFVLFDVLFLDEQTFINEFFGYLARDFRFGNFRR